jgi:hypothetical protein
VDHFQFLKEENKFSSTGMSIDLTGAVPSSLNEPPSASCVAWPIIHNDLHSDYDRAEASD